MANVAIQITEKPSNSKGWARYSVLEGERRVIESKTGNQWVSANHAGEVADGTEITLTTEVMLRVGGKPQVRAKSFSLIADTAATCKIEYIPGSQGVRLMVSGARLLVQ